MSAFWVMGLRAAAAFMGGTRFAGSMHGRWACRKRTRFEWLTLLQALSEVLPHPGRVGRRDLAQHAVPVRGDVRGRLAGGSELVVLEQRPPGRTRCRG